MHYALLRFDEKPTFKLLSMIQPLVELPMCITFRSIAILCLLAIFASLAQAQPELVCKPADIQGRVVGSTGEPIAGAKVLVQNAPYTQNVTWYATQPEENLLLGEATSDEEGRYRIKWRVKEVSALQNTSVRAVILVMKQDYAIAFRETSLWQERYIEFKLKPDVEHVGKVLDDQGKPLADAEVRVDMIFNDIEWVDRGAVFSSDDDVCSMMISSLRPRTKTDKDGNYRLLGLATGQVILLQVTHPKFPPIRRMQPVDEKSPMSIKERLGENDDFGPWYNSYRKPLQMLPGKLGKIKAVEELTGNALANVEVCRYFLAESTKSDQDGQFEYWLPEKANRRFGFGNSEYYARRPGDKVWSQAFLTVGEGDAPSELVVPLRRTITGHVRDQASGKGIEGVAVYFMNPNEKGSTFTDRDGHYSLPAYSTLNTIVLGGPKLAFDLPVDRWSSQTEEPSREIDDQLHRRTINFKRDQLNAEVGFAIPKRPKLQVRVVDAEGKALPRTEVKLRSRFSWLPRPAIATTNEAGVAEFEIDRPITVSTIWVSSAAGFSVATIQGQPDEAVTLTVKPAIAIPGLLTAKAADGTLRNAVATPVLFRHEESETEQTIQLEIAVSDQNGRFTLYLPPDEERVAKLSVNPIHQSSFYDWTVKRDEHSRADFVMDDDRMP